MAQAAKHKHYPKAPIVEATIQINFALKPASSSSVEAWAQAAAKWAKSYPISKPINAQFQQVSFGLQPLPFQPAVSMSQQHIGFRLEKPAAGYVIQLRDEGGGSSGNVATAAVSITKLAPYESWENFMEEVRVIWKDVIATKRVKAVTRLAVRYINRIEAGPMPIDINKILRIRPDTPSALEAKITNYQMQLAFELPGNFECTLRQQPLPLPQKDHIVFLFDLDVHKKQNLPKDPAKIWNDLGRLRDVKNRVFELGVTPAQKKKFLK
jgi:uncharacterized protein (TIGR04255 family)